MSMERYLCDTCLYANNCQFIAKHKEGATGCSAYINTFGVSVDRIREICAAERDGRLVVLPCKVGDTVYAITQGYCDDEDCPDDYHDYVDDIYVDAIRYQIWETGASKNEVEIKLNDYLDIEDAYLTRAEAEEAIEAEIDGTEWET
jgi:hypothetical protein